MCRDMATYPTLKKVRMIATARNASGMPVIWVCA
jgi:hypothetical protein